LLQHNARPHIAAQQLRWSRAFISSILSSTIVTWPCWLYHTFGPVKEVLGGKTSRSDKKAIEGVAETKCEAKGIFPTWNPGSCEAVDDMHWMQYALPWKMTKQYRPYLHQNRW
jgi:hypothetical protein